MEAVEYRSRACQEVAAAEVGVEGPPYRASVVAEGCQRGIREHLGVAVVEGGAGVVAVVEGEAEVAGGPTPHTSVGSNQEGCA